MSWPEGADTDRSREPIDTSLPGDNGRDFAGLDMDASPDDPPVYPSDAAYFVLVRGKHSVKIESEDDAPSWATVSIRPGRNGLKAQYKPGDGIPKPHFPESAWTAQHRRVVPVDGDGAPVPVESERDLSPEERAVRRFRERITEEN